MDNARSATLVQRARSGDERALAELFDQHRPRLERMVSLRLDAGLRRRLDPVDVVQEAWLDAAQRFEGWCSRTDLPFHVWLRLVTAQALAQAQRRHLGAHMRDAQREVAASDSRSSISAVCFADAFVATHTSPTQAAQRDEVRSRVLAALDTLDDTDREIVALRHFESLSNEDAAAELGIEPAAASKRFVRALVRLRPALASLDQRGAE